MKNKMLIIIGIVVLLFAVLMFANNYKNKQAVGDDNPYGKDKLKQETIDLLDDPLYSNIIVPEDLDQKLKDEESLTVYYFSPTCVHCQRTTPIVVPVAEEMDVDMKKMNLLEFDKMSYYDVEGTPTIIHYENGEEIARIVGEHPEEDFRMFFNKYVVD